jgi:hypothetical protein
MSKPLLTRQAVAERLNVSADWFYRNRRGLEAEGFPPSLPAFAQGRWCSRAVELWIERNSGAPQAQESAPAADTVEDRQEQLRQALQDRAQQIVTGGKQPPPAADGAD